MNERIFLNGRILELDEARISPFDRGLLFGDGLFETMRVYGGLPHLQGRHLRRLRRSADVLGMAMPSDGELSEAIASTIGANDLRDGVVRLTLTRGVGESLLEPVPGGPTLMIHCKPLLHSGPLSPEERVIVLPIRHVAPAIGRRMKGLDYQSASFAAPLMAAARVREGLVLTAEGLVAEGTVSSMFCLLDGVLCAPPISLGILDGITRGRVLELARDAGIPTREATVDLATFLVADECFYTNSVREIVPIVSVGGLDGGGDLECRDRECGDRERGGRVRGNGERRIGDGTAGRITTELARRYRAEAPADIA